MRINLNKLLFFYCLLISTFTNDIFKKTSLRVYTTPLEIRYNWGEFYVSYLFVPLTIILLLKFKKIKKSDFIHVILLTFYVFLKELFLLNKVIIDLNNYILNYTELYYQLCVVITIYLLTKIYAENDMVKLDNFFRVFMNIQILGLIAGIILNKTPNQYDYVNRFHTFNMSQGETAFIISLYILYLLYYKNKSINSVIYLFILNIFTGSRKDILYLIFLCLPKIFDINILKEKSKFSTKKLKHFSLSIISLVLFIISLLVVKDIIISKMNIDRYKEMFININNLGFKEYITNDYSGKGRMDSIKTALSILKNNYYGLTFSFYYQQLLMQLNGYPTFAHSTLIFYYMILGPYVIIILYKFIRVAFKLIKSKNSYFYVIFYIIIYHTISGGAYVNIKVLFVTIYYYLLSKKILLNFNRGL